MLSPAKLFFGADPDVPSENQNPVCSASAEPDPTWQDSDADVRTDAPLSGMETPLNESEEERRSPAVGGIFGATLPSNIVRSESSNGTPNRLPVRSEPSNVTPNRLPFLGTDELRSPALVRPLPAVNVLTRENVSIDDRSDADDEQSHLSGDYSVKESFTGSQVAHTEVRGMRYSELPSIGSANHFHGTCDRCCFHPKGRCLNGFNCQHCHFDHEKRKRKNKKKNKVKLQVPNCDQSLKMVVSGDGSLPDSLEQPPGLTADVPPVGAQSEGIRKGSYFTTIQTGGASTHHGDLNSDTWFLPSLSQTSEIAPSLHSQDGFAHLGTVQPNFEHLSGLTGGQCRQNGRTHHDKREEYIQHLEEENRYLRVCLIEYMGPIVGSMLLPELEQSFHRPHEGISSILPRNPTPSVPVSPNALWQFSQCPAQFWPTHQLAGANTMHRDADLRRIAASKESDLVAGNR